MTDSSIAANLESIESRVAAAAARAGRHANEVTLVAVTKRVDPARVVEAHRCGLRDFGESYVQEAVPKITGLANLADARWHFIGHLQSNKIREVSGRFALIQSVDSVTLAERLSKRAEETGTEIALLLEVKLDEAAAKYGLSTASLLSAVERVLALPGIKLCGLMGMAAPDPAAARSAFRLLNDCFLRLPSASRQILSMGMTGDFETAIEEGSTMIRIGTGIFGARSPEAG